MTVKDHTELFAYQKAYRLVLDIYKLTAAFPQAEQNVTQGASQLLEEVIRLLRSYVSKRTPNRYEAREDPALDTLHD